MKLISITETEPNIFFVKRKRLFGTSEGFVFNKDGENLCATSFRWTTNNSSAHWEHLDDILTFIVKNGITYFNAETGETIYRSDSK